MASVDITMVPSRDGVGSNIWQSPQKTYSINLVDDPVLGTSAPKVWRCWVEIGDFWSGDVNRADGELHNRVELIMSPNQTCAGYPSGIPWHPLEGETIWEQMEYMFPSNIPLGKLDAGGKYRIQNAQTNSSKSDNHFTGAQQMTTTSNPYFSVQNGSSSFTIPHSSLPRDAWIPVRIRTKVSASSTVGEMQAWWYNGTSWVAGTIVKGATLAFNKDGTYANGAHRKLGYYRLQPPSGDAAGRGQVYLSDYVLRLSQASLPEPRIVRFGTGTGGGGGGGGGTTTAKPTVTTLPATSITTTTATINGTVNPNGVATTCSFDWGTDGVNFPNRVTAAQSPVGSGTTAVAVSAALTGLAPGQTIYFKLGATNSVGTSVTAATTFTTSSATVPDGATLLETFATSPPSGSFTVGDNTVSGGVLTQRVISTNSRAEWQSDQYQGLGRRYYALAPLPTVSAGQAEFTYSLGIIIDSSTRIIVQRYVNTVQVPMVDKLRFRLVRSRIDSTTGATIVDDPETTSVDTPLVAGQAPGGISTVKAIAVSLMGDDGDWYLPLYSEDATESTADTGATWKQFAPARQHPVKITATTPYRIIVNTSMMQPTGTISLAQTSQVGGSKRTQAGVDTVAATTAAALSGTNPYLTANLPGGATGQTAPIPKAGYTPETQTVASPISTAQTVTPATGQAAGNYRIDFLSSNIGSSPSTAALAMLTRTYESNGWTKLIEGVNGDVAAWAFGKLLTGSETSPTVQHSDASASVAITKTLWTGVNTTLAVDIAGGGASVLSDSAATMTHSLADTVGVDNSRLVAFTTHDAATGQTGGGFTPPVIGVTSMTEIADWVTSDATSDIRHSVAHASVMAGTYAPSFTQTSGPADQGVQFGIVLRPTPGSGGTGGSVGVQEPLITIMTCLLPATGKVGLSGFESAAGVEARSAFVADTTGNATPGWAIFRDAATNTQGGDPNVVPSRSEVVTIVTQKSGGSSGNVKTHVFTHTGTAAGTWQHSAENIGPLQSGPAITASGHFIVGRPASGVTGFVTPTWIAAVGYAKPSRILLDSEVEQLVNNAGFVTKFRWQNVLKNLINQNGATDDARFYRTTTGTASWTDDMGTGVALTVGTGTVTQTAATAPAIAGTDEAPTTSVTIGDPSGLEQIGATVLHSGDPSQMDFVVKMNANSAADQALTGFGYVFFMQDPDNSETTPATQIGTATTAPTQGSPKTITVPLQSSPVEVFVIAKSNTQVSGRSAPILISPPAGVVIYDPVDPDLVAIYNGFRATWDPADADENVVEYHIEYKLRNSDLSYPASYTSVNVGAGIPTSDGRLTATITGLTKGHYKIHVVPYHVE